MRRLAVILLGSAALFGATPEGKWNVTATTESGREYKLRLTLHSDAGKWSGEMESDRGAIPASELRVTGQEVSYKLSMGDSGYEIKLAYSGDALKGTFTGTNGATGTITGTRAADFAGIWKGSAVSSRGRKRDVRLTLRQDQGEWRGTVASEEGEAELANIKSNGSELSFEIPVEDGAYRVNLTLAGTTADGTYTGLHNESGRVSLNR